MNLTNNRLKHLAGHLGAAPLPSSPSSCGNTAQLMTVADILRSGRVSARPTCAVCVTYSATVHLAFCLLRFMTRITTHLYFDFNFMGETRPKLYQKREYMVTFRILLEKPLNTTDSIWGV